MVLSYQYKLQPTDEQEQILARQAGCCRWVWNQAVAMNKDLRAKGQPAKGYVAMAKELTAWRHDTPWLAESSSVAQQQSLMNYDRARQEAFDPTLNRGEPRFKVKGKCTDSFIVPNGEYRLGRSHGRAAVVLPKLGWVRYIKSRPLAGVPKQVSVTREADGWYISIQTERTIPNARGEHSPLHPRFCSAVGLDLGVVRTVTLSDGTNYQCPKEALDRVDGKIEKAQQDLARKKKGSQNYQEQKSKLARLHQHRGRVQEDFLHKISTEIAKNHGIIVMEDLSVKSMTKSNKGTIEEPGVDVAWKSNLNRLILGQGWGQFKQMLMYKVQKMGGMLYFVNPAYTSQTCSHCGVIDKASRLSQALFKCARCLFEANADDNAASVILALWAAGQAVSACGVALEGPEPQEPRSGGSAPSGAVRNPPASAGGGCQQSPSARDNLYGTSERTQALAYSESIDERAKAAG